MKRTAIGVLLALGIAGGCSPRVKPVNVDMVYQTTLDVEAIEQLAGCQVGILEIVDDRSNQETLGMARSAILGHGFMEWMREGVHSLAAYGYTIEEPVAEATVPFSGVGIHVSVLKTFCRAQPNRLRGVVVMSVRYERNDVTLAQRTYSGESEREKSAFSSANYAFSDRAILQTLNEALDDAIAQINRDLRGFCPGGGEEQ